MQWTCAATVFLSALLLFLIQPVAANLLLPRFGGAASVWTTSMLFFPALLLAGYAYAHWLQRLAPQMQRGVHAVVATISLAVIPTNISATATALPTPELRILATLALTIGMPYFVLSATSPLVQAWYGRASEGELPYWLYAVSNAASLLALVAYPFAVEPWMRKSEQERIWSLGYLAFLVLLAAAALLTRTPHAEPARERGAFAAVWLALSAVPAAMWLAVGNHLSHAVAPVPMLWVLPLSVYLLTMILSFSTAFYNPTYFRFLFPLGVAALVAASYPMNWKATLGLYLAGLFLCCMTCHGELALRKPGQDGLTAFYLTLAAGGTLGSAFVSLVAPAIFREYLELPVSIVACVLLAVALLYGYNQRRHVLRLAIVGVVALVASTGVVEQSLTRARNFYGAVEIRETGTGADRARMLYNGSVLHGVEFLDRGHARQGTTYYSGNSGVGLEIKKLTSAARVGVIGLGIGTLATYGRPGDVYRFYEINPLVIELARRQFGFLRDSQAKVEVLEGDARLLLASEPQQGYDVLVLDAFTGDAVPVHLLTQEAFRLYKRHLKPGGVIAAHVSSRYLSLSPVVLSTAATVGLDGQTVITIPEQSRRISSSTWVILRSGKPAAPSPSLVWTDDYSSLLSVL
ncbi:MAG: fused MFS/spermidine synthase [Acidobacteria bacterium]|nr:fused MFS/spermidine synthase [Acidobacteriota bacterium]